MRKNFYEILAEMKFSYWQEYNTLLHLFRTEDCVYDRYRWITLSQYIDENYFRVLPCRGTFTSMEQLMKAVQIKPSANSLEDLFVLSEFLVAVLPEEQLQKHMVIRPQAQTILENIGSILEKTNHELIEIPGSNGCWIVVEKNRATTRAVEIVEDGSVAFDLLEYNHFALKGNLERKRKILASIGMYIEPILRSKALQNAGYRKIESDVGFVLNNFHIRHNNKDGAKMQNYIAACSDNELEAWYDNAYNMLVAVIILNEHLPVEAAIATLKQGYTWRT